MAIVGCWLSCGHQVVHRVWAAAVTGTDLTGVRTLWCSRCAPDRGAAMSAGHRGRDHIDMGAASRCSGAGGLCAAFAVG